MITKPKHGNNKKLILEAADYLFSSKHHKTWLSGV